jgi:tetratricopeptide (TPR) repeat protein
MCNKTVLVSRFLFIIMSFGIVSVCLADEPDTASDAYDWAEIHFKSQNYDRAKPLYTLILDNWPDDVYYAPRALAGLAKSNLALGDAEAGDAAVDKLLSEYSDNPHIGWALHHVAQHCKFLEQYERARGLYQYFLEHWPEDHYAMWCRIGLAQVDDFLGNTQAAESAIAEVLADYSQHEDMPAVVCNTAQHYFDVRNYEKARYYYQYVIDTWPEHEYAMWSRQGLAELQTAEATDTSEEWAQIVTQINLAKSNIANADANAAQAVVDELLNDRSGHPRLPEAIYEIARHCVDSAVYQMGAELHQYLLEMWPDHPKAIWARMGLAEAYGTLGNAEAAKATTNQMLAFLPQTDPAKPDAVWTTAHVYFQLQSYEQAIQYFQQILDYWPGYNYAWSAQSWIGECYEKLKSTGSLPESQANALIEDAYLKVIRNHPNCSLIGHASLKLAYLTAEQNRWPEAAAYFELFIDATPDDPRAAYVLYDLGRAYENSGELNLAIPAYAQFIEATDPNSPTAKELKDRFAQLLGEGEPQ